MIYLSWCSDEFVIINNNLMASYHHIMWLETYSIISNCCRRLMAPPLTSVPCFIFQHRNVKKLKLFLPILKLFSLQLQIASYIIHKLLVIYSLQLLASLQIHTFYAVLSFLAPFSLPLVYDTRFTFLLFSLLLDVDLSISI